MNSTSLVNTSSDTTLESEKPTDLTRSASLNAIAAALDYVVRLLTGFLLTPILIVGLGDQLFGVWQVMSRIVSYVSAAGGRPTAALKWAIANQLLSTDSERKRRIVGSAILSWAVFLPLLATVGGLFAWYLPILIHLPQNLYGVVRLASLILVLDLIVTNLTEIPQAVLRGENKDYRRMGLATVLIFLTGAMIALAINWNTGLVGVATATLFGTLITGALYFYVIRHSVSWFGISRPSIEEARQFLGLSGWFLIWHLLVKLMLTGDVMLLGTLEGADAVTNYSLMRFLPQTIIGIIAVLAGGAMPGLGGLVGKGDFLKASQTRNEIMLLSWLLLTAIGSVVLLLGRSFMTLWVGEEYYLGSYTMLAIVIMNVQFVLIRNDANVIDLTLTLRRKVLLGTVAIILSILLSIIMVHILGMGILGLVLGFVAGQLVLSVSYPRLVGIIMGTSILHQLRSSIRPAICSILIFATNSMLGEMLNLDNWLAIAITAITDLVVVLLLALLLGINPANRTRLRNRLKLFPKIFK
jgi:O-antigen/teichoic acid export membrane protein